MPEQQNLFAWELPPRPKGTPLTPAEEKVVLSLVKAGKKIIDVCRACHVAAPTVARIVERGRARTPAEYVAISEFIPTEYDILVACRKIRIDKGEWCEDMEENLRRQLTESE